MTELDALKILRACANSHNWNEEVVWACGLEYDGPAYKAAGEVIKEAKATVDKLISEVETADAAAKRMMAEDTLHEIGYFTPFLLCADDVRQKVFSKGNGAIPDTVTDQQIAAICYEATMNMDPSKEQEDFIAGCSEYVADYFDLL
jgi:hypothetical protein